MGQGNGKWHLGMGREMTDAPKPPPVPRLRTNADRDHALPKTNPRGVPIPIPADITGVFVGEELRAQRARRPTDIRIERLEDKHDDLVGVVSDIRESVGRVVGQLEVLPDLVQAVQDASAQAGQRELTLLTAHTEIDKAGKVSEIEIRQATQIDAIDSHKAKRWLVAKLAGAVVGAIEGGHWVLHHFGVL